MEISIKTIMIVVMGLIAVIMLLMLFSAGQDQSNNILSSIFDYLNIFGGGS